MAVPNLSAMPDRPLSASDHPPTWKFDYPIFHAETRAQWRTWLEVTHATERGVWLCSWRTHVERPRCPYPEAVEEAICFGWIDSTGVTLDDERGLQLFTPRKPKSTWTRLNRRRAADLEAQGLMTDAGRRAIEVAQANGWWTILDPVEDLIEPDDLTAALDADPTARATWDAYPTSIKKQQLLKLYTAAKPETRARRVEAITATAAAGERPAG